MEKIFIFIGIFLIIVGIIIYYKLRLYAKKIEKTEQFLLAQFSSRSDSLPALYEITKDTLLKHKNVFSEIIRLKKQEFELFSRNANPIEIMNLENKITDEIQFIFKVCSKHPKMMSERNFIYLREIFIQKSENLKKLHQNYALELEKYNKYIKIKNATLIGLLIPIYEKITL